jgi:hypothetical protein
MKRYRGFRSKLQAFLKDNTVNHQNEIMEDLEQKLECILLNIMERTLFHSQKKKINKK